MSGNLDLWRMVEETDPTKTKKVNQRGGYTAIDPQYQLKCATEQFGPYGKGFGFELCDFDFSQIELGLVIVKAVFFYMQGKERYTFPINNAWQIKQGSRIDVDFAKKAETNTMSKALSKLGFSADVFMGQFDDTEYVSMIGSKKDLEAAEDKLEEERKQKLEYEQKCQKEVDMLKSASNANELKALFVEYTRRANLWQDKDQVKRLSKAKDSRKEALENESSV